MKLLIQLYAVTSITGALRMAPTAFGTPAADSLRPPVLSQAVEISFGNLTPSPPTNWIPACKALGEMLLLQRGPWGMGVFVSYHCTKGKRQVLGQPNPVTPLWRVSLTRRGKQVIVRVRHVRGGSDTKEFSLVAGTELHEAFADQEVAAALVATIVDLLPMAQQVTAAQIGKDITRDGLWSRRYLPAGKNLKTRVRALPPGERLVFYRLTWDRNEKLWRSDVVGYGRRRSLKQRSASYRLDQDVLTALAIGPLWVHDAAGPGSRTKEFSSHLETALNSFRDYRRRSLARQLIRQFLDSAASGYIGPRYGRQLAPGEPTLQGATMIGLLLEIRSGPFDGLRYYYDHLPRIDTTTQLSPDHPDGAGVGTTHLEWSRHVIGYSFGLDPGMVVDEINVTPKVGAWTLDAVLPTIRDADNLVLNIQEFRISRSVSAGIELGLEWTEPIYTLRLWGGLDRGTSLAGDGFRVTSRRVGSDAFFNLGSPLSLFGVPIRFSVLVFAAGESVLLADTQAEGNDIAFLELNGFYTGAGVTVAW